KLWSQRWFPTIVQCQPSGPRPSDHLVLGLPRPGGASGAGASSGRTTVDKQPTLFGNDFFARRARRDMVAGVTSKPADAKVAPIADDLTMARLACRADAARLRVPLFGPT